MDRALPGLMHLQSPAPFVIAKSDWGVDISSLDAYGMEPDNSHTQLPQPVSPRRHYTNDIVV